ncbi:hypothetical protein [Burkholderia phage FLC9]|nr:hypothetical protein [Burkholderia phage FLC9]
MFDNFEFSFGSRRETISARVERERRERAQERTEDLLRTLFGGMPKEVPVTVRTTVEEDTVFGRDTQERTRTAVIKLVPGLKLAKSEVEPTVFGSKITTVVIENLDHLDLAVTTKTTEKDTVFGKHIVTEVFIATEAEQAAAQPTRPTMRERVTVRVSPSRRPR